MSAKWIDLDGVLELEVVDGLIRFEVSPDYSRWKWQIYVNTDCIHGTDWYVREYGYADSEEEAKEEIMEYLLIGDHIQSED